LRVANADDVSNYKWTVLLITTVGAFMAPLDGSIVNIAIPSIAASIGIGLEAAIWIPLAYLLVLTVLLVNVGRLADLKGRKRFYTLGFVIFTAGSVLCSVAATELQLVPFRAIQGAGAAFIAANSAAIVTDTFPRWERGKALGINSMAVYVGLMAGPVIGGVLVNNYGWRSIFYVNLPIGILVVALATFKVRETRSNERGEGFDIAGGAALSTTLAPFLIVLTLGGYLGWSSPLSIGLLALGGLSFLIFLLIEGKYARYPTFDLGLLARNRLFATANAAAFLSYVAVTGVTLMISIYLQSVRGLDPQTAGLYLIAQSTAMALLSPFSGWLSDRLGSRLLSSSGMFCVTLGLFLFTQVNATSSALDVVWRLVLVGIGYGLFSSPNTSAVMGSVKQEKLGVAAGTLGTMRFMGQSIGVALLGTLMATALPPTAMLQLLTGGSSQSGLVAEEFAQGMRSFFLAAAFVGAFATLTSMIRGHERANAE